MEAHNIDCLYQIKAYCRQSQSKKLMRNQVLKSRNLATLKNIVNKNQQTDTIYGNDQKYSKVDEIISIYHPPTTIDKQSSQDQQIMDPLQKFLKSIPKYSKKMKSLSNKPLPKVQIQTGNSSIEKTSFHKTRSCIQKQTFQVVQAQRKSSLSSLKQSLKSEIEKVPNTFQKLKALKQRNQKNVKLNFTFLDKEVLRKKQRQEDNSFFIHLNPKFSRNCNKSILYNFIRNGKIKQLDAFNLQPQQSIKTKSNAKQKVMTKLSRKHIYHTLKHKSEVNKKMKSKISQYQHKNKNPINQTFDLRFNDTVRLHCTSNKKFFNNIQVRSTKHYTSPHEPSYHSLMKSRKQQIQLLSQEILQSPIYSKQMKDVINTQIKFNSSESNFIIRQNQEDQFSIYKTSNRLESSNRQKQRIKIVNKVKQKQEQYQFFRQLTPWHSQDIE